MAMTLHGSPLSFPTYKVALMLSMAGEPFTFKYVNLRQGEHKKPEFLAMNRFGQVPVLVDGEQSYCQSNAILLHLAERLGKFGGGDAAGQRTTLEWLSWEADQLLPGIARPRFYKRFMQDADPMLVAHYVERGEGALKTLEAGLAGQPFLGGQTPSVADISVYATVVHAAEGGFDLARWPLVQAWVARMGGQPGAKPAPDLMPMPQ
ncbi:glutathione S-transferase [Stella humosa]|uniref:Glutathione S-transferase n=1 Tax=Stella humosa TaxID=94 RepID=A0A3N1KV10_9PROT|nr:glutathione S-transferase family protein [Stella humosa]ROP81175.1 glutathione S-transferase [Stella humosa]BBK32521.1 glutathione S-transferase [Stella humosa]